METRNDDPPGEALGRLIGYAGELPPPCRGDVSRQLFAATERFSLLRRLGVESVWVAHQGRRVDSSLLLEVGALTTNRLIAVAEALADRSFTRQSFFNLMHSQVDSHREMDGTWPARTSGVRSLVAAQKKFGLLEWTVSRAAGLEAMAAVRREAADCAVYISFFLEAMRRRVPEWRD